PLSLLNLFEALYIVSLAYQLKGIINFSFTKSIKFVIASYGTGVLFWAIFITFLSVSLAM
ncbi:MAG: hypothetical protein ACKO1F_11680, partial [Flammeovirgaceae bacterium]